MDLITIGEQPDGFCPPELSAKIVKVWDRKSGTNETGDWSFQNVDVEQSGTKATIKLKNLPEFPTARTGQLVAISAHKSDKHGLIGLKTETREYNGRTYKSIVVTPSAKWSWGQAQSQAATGANGNGQPQTGDATAYAEHILAVAELVNRVMNALVVDDAQAVQACFATICIDSKNRGILLPKPKAPAEAPEHEEAPEPDDEPMDIPF